VWNHTNSNVPGGEEICLEVYSFNVRISKVFWEFRYTMFAVTVANKKDIVKRLIIVLSRQ
jgi:hypothetical protein